jgi:hypothetical protein
MLVSNDCRCWVGGDAFFGVVLKEKRCTDADVDAGGCGFDAGDNKKLRDGGDGWRFIGAEVSSAGGEDRTTLLDEFSDLCSSSSSVRFRRFGITKVASVLVIIMGS